MYTAVKRFQNFLSRNKLESKPFQSECFRWCIGKEEKKQHEQHKPGADAKPGGILALEMGLGKTIVMLGLLKCNVKAQTLIVLPLSLLDQWEKCIIKFCVCKPLVYHGSRKQNMKISLAELKAYPIVITTYGQVSLPSVKQAIKGRMQSRLHDIVWDRVICDEAHHVSHPKTNEFKGVQALQTKICWLVTGTPLQNNEKELYTLYSLFGLPNKKYYYDTANNYADVAKQLIFHSTKAGAGLALPPLHEHTVNLEWQNEGEREFAWHIHSLLPFCRVPQKALAQQIVAECDNPNVLRMRYLAKAQQVCVYPPMLKGGTLLNPLGASPHTPLEGEMSSLDVDVLCEGGLPSMGVQGGHPLKINTVLQTLLERKGNGCGKIVFCHYHAEMDVLYAQLLQADPTLQIAKFDGRVLHSQRDDILQQPVDILIAQIKMCREGLNLQEHYSEVYFPSPDFNPATEQQAIARCWRIGQKKTVHVFRFLMGGMPPTPPNAGIIGGIDEVSTTGGPGAREEGDSRVVEPFTGGPGGLPPLTMDMFSSQLHTKKQALVEKMAGAATSYSISHHLRP